MQARVTRTTASVGSLIAGSGTFSIRTSPAPYMTVARMSVPPSSCCLTVDHPLLGLGVASACRRDLCRGGVELPQVVVAERAVGRGDVLFQAVELRGTGNRHV